MGLRGTHSRRGIYILPNLFTTAGLFFGFYAIVQATLGHFENAAIGIFVAMLMDGLDGRVARITNTTSDFGKEYDSLADVIAFGLAPALVMFEWSLSASGKIGWLCAFVYVSATALRLARFNTQEVRDKRFFQGMPCPAAAACVAAWVWTFSSFGITDGFIEGLSLLMILALSLAMVGNVRYRSFKELDLKGKVPFVALIVPVIVLATISFDPPRVLFTIFFAYLVSGPISWLGRRCRRRRRASGARSPAGGTAPKPVSGAPPKQPGSTEDLH